MRATQDKGTKFPSKNNRKRKAPSESAVEDVSPPKSKPGKSIEPAALTPPVQNPKKGKSRTRQLAESDSMDISMSPIPGPSTLALPIDEADSDYTDIEDEDNAEEELVPTTSKASGRWFLILI